VRNPVRIRQLVLPLLFMLVFLVMTSSILGPALLHPPGATTFSVLAYTFLGYVLWKMVEPRFRHRRLRYTLTDQRLVLSWLLRRGRTDDSHPLTSLAPPQLHRQRRDGSGDVILGRLDAPDKGVTLHDVPEAVMVADLIRQGQDRQRRMQKGP
jgi:hypothetical protein